MKRPVVLWIHVNFPIKAPKVRAVAAFEFLTPALSGGHQLRVLWVKTSHAQKLEAAGMKAPDVTIPKRHQCQEECDRESNSNNRHPQLHTVAGISESPESQSSTAISNH